MLVELTLIKQQVEQQDRLKYLNKMAIEQMTSLKDSAAAHRLNEMVSLPTLKEVDSDEK